MMTFGVEQWSAIKLEVLPLLIPHYEEVGQDKERLKLDPDMGKFDRLEAAGLLHIVIARRDGKLVGYHCSIVDTLLHYRTVLAASSDAYWLKQDCRGPGVSIRLFQEVERSLKARGVKVMYEATKVYLDHSRLLEHLGYRKIENRFSKWIGD